jgi:hypothetical protein
MSEETTHEDAPAGEPGQAGIPDPVVRRRSPHIRGVEAVMGDGRTWILALLGLSPALDEVRDRMFEDLAMDGGATFADILMVCYCALQANYVLSDREAFALIAATPPESIVDEILECVIPSLFGGDRSYTHWARSALLKNGIAPESLPPSDMPHVLHHLVAAGQALPPSRFTVVGRHVALRSSLRQMMAEQDRERAAINRPDAKASEFQE